MFSYSDFFNLKFIDGTKDWRMNAVHIAERFYKKIGFNNGYSFVLNNEATENEDT